MHHQGKGMPVDFVKAMDWYLKAYQKNGDAMNNIGVMYRDGLGVNKNRKIAYLLFLYIHMEGMGGEETVMRANRNLRHEIAELPSAERHEALCYNLAYLVSYIESKGVNKKDAKALRESEKQKRIRDMDWWAPGEVGEFTCPSNT